MISRFALMGIASLVIAVAPAQAVGKKKNVSWGKAGVSLVDYSADSLACSNMAYGAVVKPRPYGPVALDLGTLGAFLPASLWMKLSPGEVPVYSTTYVAGYKHAMWTDVVEQLQAVVDACLVERGYHRFRLTPAQMSALSRMKQGSPEREAFLHSLGSDARVLSAQAV